MGLREGAKEIWRTVVRRPIVPQEGEYNAPLELVGPFTMRIPDSPTRGIDSPKPDAELPNETVTDSGNK